MGPTLFNVDAQGCDGKRFIVRSDELLTAFLELEWQILKAEAKTVYRVSDRSDSDT